MNSLPITQTQVHTLHARPTCNNNKKTNQIYQVPTFYIRHFLPFYLCYKIVSFDYSYYFW